jgi:NAD(P)-dependent dehydrogenase (short-subunit alcohol dehydrogenase family)
MLSEKNHESQVALMFGGGSGLAQLSAIRWARQGGTAIALDINEAGLKATAAAHPQVTTMPVDVSDFAAVQDSVQVIENRYGPICRVDNAAAIFPTNLALEMNAEFFAQVMRVNFQGMVNVSLACLPPMLSRSRGVLVNYCSIAGLIPYLHMAAYSASKSACVTFTEILYHENKRRGVDIVCLCPPSVDTPLLAQATSHPRIMESSRPMSPSEVLDSLDKAIRKRRFWCLPSWQTRFLVQLRKICPSLLWRLNHQIEGI